MPMLAGEAAKLVSGHLAPGKSERSLGSDVCSALPRWRFRMEQGSWCN